MHVSLVICNPMPYDHMIRTISNTGCSSHPHNFADPSFWFLSRLSMNDSLICIASDMPCRPGGKEKWKRREQLGRSNHFVRGIHAAISIDGSAAVHGKSVECFLWWRRRTERPLSLLVRVGPSACSLPSLSSSSYRDWSATLSFSIAIPASRGGLPSFTFRCSQ